MLTNLDNAPSYCLGCSLLGVATMSVRKLPEWMYVQLSLVVYTAKLLARGWSEKRVEETEQGYRQFLFEAAMSKHEPTVPSADVDELWHLHILDTQRYGSDCNRLFGRFIHHAPSEATCEAPTASTCDAPAAATCDAPAMVATCRAPAHTGFLALDCC